MVARRSRRSAGNTEGSPAPSSQTPASTKEDDEISKEENSPSSELCPACPPDKKGIKGRKKKDMWVSCEGCQTWYHWECVGEGADLALIDKWYCGDCLSKDSSLSITHKAPPRKSSRAKTKQDYASLNDGLPGDPNRWVKVLKTKKITKDSFRRMKGSELTLSYVENDESALTEPVVILSPEGLGMKMPGDDFTVDDVVALVGANVPVEVIDVAQQSSSPGWNLQSWAEYYNKPASQRDKIRNVISLEVTNTKLSERIIPPRIVSELDWVQKFWPSNRRGKGQFPKVGLYCLMSVAQCWTDWHVDFAGSSVYYHVLRGAKDFYFIRPTETNLAAYEKWSGSAELQAGTWLGDMVDSVIKVSLVEGNTMIIPTGWIHCVYTPVDSLVFGGNFLHSYNIATQLRVREIEINTKVPKKFRFPLFQRMCWYVAESYNQQLKARAIISDRALRGLASLAEFLVSEARLLEGAGDSAQRREAKDAIPVEKVKDAPALAREFQWRVRLARGQPSEDEDDVKESSVVKKSARTNGKGKRKRVIEDSDEEEQAPKRIRPNFKNWTPPTWDVEAERDLEEKKDRVAAEKAGDWVITEGSLDKIGTDGPEGVEHVTSGKEWMRVRKIKDEEGRERVERVRVTRIVESWTWGYEKPTVKVEDQAEQKEGDGDIQMGDGQHEDETDGTVVVSEQKPEDMGSDSPIPPSVQDAKVI